MKRVLCALALTALVAVGLVGCDCDYRGPDVKVKENSGNTYVYYYNDFKPGDVTITPTEDGGYNVTIHVQPGEARRAP